MSQLIEKIQRIASKLTKSGESTSSNNTKAQSRAVRDSRPSRSGMTNNHVASPRVATGTFTGLIVALSLACVPALFTAPDTHATASTITVGITGNPVLNLKTTTDGVFGDSGNTTVIVTTTHAAGYNLTLSANGAYNPTSLDTNGGAASGGTVGFVTLGTLKNSQDVCPSGIDADDFDTSDCNGYWGYKPSKYNSVDNTTNNYYYASPTASGDTLDTTNNANNGSYTVSIGARADTNTAIAEYSNTFVFIVTGNPTPYAITYNQNTTDAVANMPTNHTTSDAGASGETVIIANNVPERDGYSFKGWCSTVTSNGSCSGTTYNPDGAGTGGMALTINQQSATNSYTLYAIWEAKGVSLYDLVAAQIKTNATACTAKVKDKNGQNRCAQTLAQMQAVITKPTSSNPATDTSNSGVFLYDASTYGIASDATNTNDIYYYRGILDSDLKSTGEVGDISTYGSYGNSAYYHNYVRLGGANTSSTCWRIVRTTGSGGVKMIYNGNWTTDDGTGTCAHATTTAQITLNDVNKFYFNRESSTIGGNSGYGTQGRVVLGGYSFNSSYRAGSSSIANSILFRNGTNSNVKTQVENWYDSNISSYTSILETSAGYCVDRTTYSSDSATATPTTSNIPYNTSTGVYFGGNHRNRVSGNKLSLACPNTTGYDILTTANGLSKPVALLTVDEAALAGEGYFYFDNAPRTTSPYSSNWSKNTFLTSGQHFWLLSPNLRSPTNGNMSGFEVNYGGGFGNYNIWGELGIRPVISLASGVLATSGSGTATDPWAVPAP